MSHFNLYGNNKPDPRDVARLVPQCRDMLPTDVKNIRSINTQCFGDDPETKLQLPKLLQARDVRAFVRIDEANRVVGHCVYVASLKSYTIACLAVRPVFQGRGHGKAMIQHLAGMLEHGKRDRIIAVVDNQFWQMQEFLRHHGFLCISESMPDWPRETYELRLAPHPFQAAEAVCDAPA